MVKPIRHYFMHAAVATRSYEEGLDAIVSLLRFTEVHRRRLGEEEYQTYLTFLYYFMLEMFDRLDRWDEFLEVWERLRDRTRVVLIAPVQPSETPSLDSVSDCVLSLTRHRRDLIVRKLEKKRAGKKLGNLLHARPEELSDEEIEERLERILGWARSGELWISTLPC